MAKQARELGVEGELTSLNLQDDGQLDFAAGNKVTIHRLQIVSYKRVLYWFRWWIVEFRRRLGRLCKLV